MLVPQDETEADDASDEKTPIECEHCEYEWEYSGELWSATCPRCGRKTPTGLKPDEFED